MHDENMLENVIYSGLECGVPALEDLVLNIQ